METPLPSRNSVSALYKTVIGWFGQTLWLRYTKGCSLWEAEAGSQVIRPLGPAVPCELLIPEAASEHERESVKGSSDFLVGYSVVYGQSLDRNELGVI